MPSQNARQNNLFAAEDFRRVYKAFQNVDFRAYDFESIKAVLIDYIRDQYPEDFNDYIESSEFIILIDVLAFLATSLAFRVDLNARENVLDTAERRESLIRLARWINYQPRRNIPANGLFKLQAVETTEQVTDSAGNRLNNVTIFWDDANNPDSFEQFITILNAAFATQSQFGTPVKRKTIGGIPTDLYQLNSVPNTNIVYPVNINANGETLRFEAVNSDIDNTLGIIKERNPNPANAFHVIYRNDSQGLASQNTGFFLFLKQGELQKQDAEFEFPRPNRLHEINVQNVNESDVYVQEIDESGNVVEDWDKVPNLVGNNVIYNSQELGVRNIYSVITQPNDTVSIKYSDGNFGNVPTGIFRTWVRSSVNRNLTISPRDANNLTIEIPYFDKRGQEQTLRLVFRLETTLSNSQPSETNAQIRERAPQIYYTQNRMVNNEDYNVFPLTRGNEIVKLKSINRTYAGHSRFIDINDPTGRHQNILVVSDDGTLYKEPYRSRNLITYESFDVQSINESLSDNNLKIFFYEDYITKFKELSPGSFDFRDINITWKTSPDLKTNNTGYFLDDTESVFNTQSSEFLEEGSKITFAKDDKSDQYITVTVVSIDNFGIPLEGTPGEIGPIQLSSEVLDGWQIISILPPLRTVLNESEIEGDIGQESISDMIDQQNDFALYYDLEVGGGTWFVLGPDVDLDDEFSLNEPDPGDPDGRWLIKFTFKSDTESSNYEVITRGTRYIFESLEDVRFFFDPENRAYDLQRGRFINDTINILGTNYSPSLTEWWEYQNNDEWSLLRRSDEKLLTAEYGNGLIFLPSRSIEKEDVRVWMITDDDGRVEVNLGDFNDDILENGVLKASELFSQTGPQGPLDSVNNPDQLEIHYEPIVTHLGDDINWEIIDRIVLDDGYVDQSKVEVQPLDSDRDGVADDPRSFSKFVNEKDRVFFERFTDFDNFEYFRPWKTGWIDLTEVQNINLTTPGQISGYSLLDNDLIIVQDETQANNLVSEFNDLTFDGPGGDKTTTSTFLQNKVVLLREEEKFMVMAFTREFDVNNNITDIAMVLVDDKDHIMRVGRSFTLNENSIDKEVIAYRWEHFAPRDSRIDPSITNIHDMFVLTSDYVRQVQLWKENNDPLESFPEKPTTEELRMRFSDLEEFKTQSDQMVWKPAKFKLLFGRRADQELQATFRVVKVPGTSVTDNEVKARVVSAIDEYFEIGNFDFGETFFYTELSTFIHQRLAGVIGSVVVVPKNESSNFGNLFQVRAETDEVFLSTATVSDVEIVRGLTEENLRIDRR